MKIYILSIFMLISVGLSAQTVISKSQATGDWSQNGNPADTWWPSSASFLLSDASGISSNKLKHIIINFVIRKKSLIKL